MGTYKQIIDEFNSEYQSLIDNYRLQHRENYFKHFPDHSESDWLRVYIKDTKNLQSC